MTSNVRSYRIADLPRTDQFPFHIGTARVHGSFWQHTHDYVELVVILAGRGRQVINGRSYTVCPGDVAVFNLGAAHGFEDGLELEMVNVVYAPSLLGSVGADVRALAGFQALFVLGSRSDTDYRCMVRLDAQALGEVRLLLARMAEELGAERPGYQTLLRSLLHELVVFLSRHYAHARATVAAPAVALKLADALAYMVGNFREPLSVAELAARAGLSDRHFLRLFRRVYGTTPLQHLLGLRLQHAAQALHAGSTSVTEIAFDSGFTDSNYFARLFTRQFGVSPTRYRASRI
jgi:AraC-like DNA-binding protein